MPTGKAIRQPIERADGVSVSKVSRNETLGTESNSYCRDLMRPDRFAIMLGGPG